MGTVYSGVHPVIGTQVAIKVIDPLIAQHPQAMDRFIQEARAANQIRHRSIIDVFSFGHSEGLGHYFVMPLLIGRSLSERIESEGPLSVAEALPIVSQIADALDAAHDAEIYHRDLKPANVFLEEQATGPEQVRILDFGIAKLAGSGAVASTAAGATIGTPLFMSPEQWDGPDVDHRTDIYAFGVLVHYMLTCRFPFESDSTVELMTMHALELATPPSRHGAPIYLDPVIERALQKDKEFRYGRATDLYHALRTRSEVAALLDTSVGLPTPGPTATQPPMATTLTPAMAEPTRIGMVLPALLVVSALLAAGVAILLNRFGSNTPETMQSQSLKTLAKPPAPAPKIDRNGPLAGPMNMESAPPAESSAAAKSAPGPAPRPKKLARKLHRPQRPRRTRTSGRPRTIKAPPPSQPQPSTTVETKIKESKWGETIKEEF